MIIYCHCTICIYCKFFHTHTHILCSTQALCTGHRLLLDDRAHILHMPHQFYLTIKPFFHKLNLINRFSEFIRPCWFSSNIVRNSDHTIQCVLLINIHLFSLHNETMVLFIALNENHGQSFNLNATNILYAK